MLRGFTDSTGVEWRVWEVLPAPTADTQTSAETFSLSSLKETPFANGWLCFESPEEKRRLAPIPVDWQFNDSGFLEQLCQNAAIVPARKPRVAHH